MLPRPGPGPGGRGGGPGGRVQCGRDACMRERHAATGADACEGREGVAGHEQAPGYVYGRGAATAVPPRPRPLPRPVPWPWPWLVPIAVIVAAVAIVLVLVLVLVHVGGERLVVLAHLLHACTQHHGKDTCAGEGGRDGDVEGPGGEGVGVRSGGNVVGLGETNTHLVFEERQGAVCWSAVSQRGVVGEGGGEGG